MPTIREKLTALYNAARDGGNVDAAELVSLEAQVQAEDTITALAAEGEASRAAEKAARERDAIRATAATEARDTIGAARDRIPAAYQTLVDALGELEDACTDYSTAIRDTRDILHAAGFAMWNQHVPETVEPLDHPDYDARMHTYNGISGTGVHVDNTLHTDINPVSVLLWAAQPHQKVLAGLSAWKSDRDNYPPQCPMPELTK